MATYERRDGEKIMRVLISSYAALALFSLAACAAAPATPLPAPEPIVKTVTVDRIIQVPCIAAVPDLPIYSDSDMAIDAIPDSFDGAWTGISLLKGGKEQRNRYIDGLRALLEGCLTK